MIALKELLDGSLRVNPDAIHERVRHWLAMKPAPKQENLVGLAQQMQGVRITAEMIDRYRTQLMNTPYAAYQSWPVNSGSWWRNDNYITASAIGSTLRP